MNIEALVSAAEGSSPTAMEYVVAVMGLLGGLGVLLYGFKVLSESIEKGWYVPGQGGTSSMNVGNLLESHGMTVSRFIHASMEDIATALAQGHHVIVGVDSGELWNSGTWETFEDFLNSGGADHALIVSGIQLNPLTAEREVVLTDPGTGEVAHTYTIDQFLDAWGDSDNFMVIANI